MQEVFKLLIGLVFLVIGIPVGDFLNRLTKDEQKAGQKWFKILIAVSIAIGLYGLIVQDDTILFTFFFIAIVTSRSLVVNPKKRIKKSKRLKK